MSGVIKTYGIIIIFILMMFIVLNYQYGSILVDNIYNNTRTIQQTAMADSVNIGEFIVNKKLTIDEQRVIDGWIENFKETRDINLTYDIDILGVLNEPPAILVRVRGYSDLHMSTSKIDVDYTNLIIIEEMK